MNRTMGPILGGPAGFAQQSPLGNDFATNQTQAMEMPSYDAGEKAEKVRTSPRP